MDNKTVLIYGPAPTPEKSLVVFDDYDYILIFNEMIYLLDTFNINFNKTKIIFFCNGYMETNNIDIILKNNNKITYIILKRQPYNTLKTKIENEKIFVVKPPIPQPTGICYALEFLKRYKNVKIIITGVTLYNNVDNNYDNYDNTLHKYIEKSINCNTSLHVCGLNHSSKINPLIHNLNDDLNYLIKYIKNNNVVILDNILINIINKLN